jgi:hypothetical protein
VSTRKPEQSGALILGLAWCLYIADCEPANTLYATPGIEFLRDVNSSKAAADDRGLAEAQ